MAHLSIIMNAVRLIPLLLFVAWDGPVAKPGDHHPGPDHRDDGFAFCLLEFDSDRVEAHGTGWKTDYPKAGQNFSIRLGELTTVRSTETQWVVGVGSPELFNCPMTWASDVGTMNLSPAEAENLRAYLLKGGFLWVDDFWGTPAWVQWLRELGKFAPAGSQILTPAPGHPIHRMHFNTSETLQVSNIGFWSAQGEVSERGEDSPPTPLKVLAGPDGEVFVAMTHNSDIQDTWEQEASHPGFFELFSPKGYAQGINLLLFASTH